jgi:4-amino-4-deoxy-L-arabinose transferase-like glycosyltransferase
MKINKEHKTIFIFLFFGLLVRVFFTLFIAQSYFGRENVYVDGDTSSWAECIENLIKTGTYTIQPLCEYCYFVRMPGYSFFIGIFFLITGQNWEAAFPIIGWVQIFFDVWAIWIIYKIGLLIFSDKKIALILAFLYATYPFIIVWNPVVYSESMSIFFMLTSLFYFLHEKKKYNLIKSGILISFAILFRPQIAIIIPIMIFFILYKNRQNFKILCKKTLQFIIIISIVYGAWPLRNYINYNKIILTQDIRNNVMWREDVISYIQYIYSVKSEWQPQFGQIIRNEKVSFPDAVNMSKDDSLKLVEAIYLSQNCGSGFSRYPGYWKERVNGENCDKRINELFTELRNNQIKNNPVQFYLLVPLQNLKKALFKTTLYDSTSLIRKAASFLFYYRSFLIILGLIGCILIFKRKIYNNMAITIILLYFIVLYVMLCGGTSIQFRNIEMRYFLPADILLLIPASYLIHRCSKFIFHLKSRLIFKPK